MKKTTISKKSAKQRHKLTLNEAFQSWLTAQGEVSNKQTFDNNPSQILGEFPAKESSTISQEYLQERLWWWRFATSEGCQIIFSWPNASDRIWADILFPTYQDHWEKSAYLYELNARFDSRYQWAFGVPWVKCSNEQRRFLACLWPNDSPALNWLPSDQNNPKFVTLGSQRFNLELNDSVLQGQFLKAINALRKREKVHRPKPGKGIRRKPVSWLPLEFMDIRHYGFRILNNAERPRLTKAFAQYQAECAKVGIAP